MSVGPDNPLRVELEHTAELVCRVDSKPPTESVRWEYSGRFIDTNFRHVIPQVNKIKMISRDPISELHKYHRHFCNIRILISSYIDKPKSKVFSPRPVLNHSVQL